MRFAIPPTARCRTDLSDSEAFTSNGSRGRGRESRPLSAVTPFGWVRLDSRTWAGKGDGVLPARANAIVGFLVVTLGVYAAAGERLRKRMVAIATG